MPTFSLPALLRALLVWLLIIAGESLHGALRRLLFSPDVLFALRQASVVVAVLIVFAATWVCLPWLRLRSPRGALGVGALWVALRLGFEAVLGRLTGLSWDRIFAEYDLTRGGLMPLGLLAMGLTPWLVLQLQAAPRKLGKTP
jgi:hypothetical protein